LGFKGHRVFSCQDGVISANVGAAEVPLLGELALRYAMLEQAIIDAVTSGASTGVEWSRARIRRDARHWIFGEPEPDGISFSQACEDLDLCPDTLRNKISRCLDGQNGNTISTRRTRNLDVLSQVLRD